MFESLLFRPNFPTAPSRSFDFFTFPNDLVTDKRQYFTEMQFYAYNPGIKLPKITPGSNGNPIGNIEGDFSINQGYTGNALGNIKLPIPQRINDIMTFSWGQGSAWDVIGSLAQAAAYSTGQIGNLAYLGAGAVRSALGAAGAYFGIALNPQMYQQFQNPNYREFSFQWLLAPRTKTESATIASMITILKRAASPGRGANGFLLTYPLIAMIKFWPNNLTGHPSDKVGGINLKPCVITSISVDHTPVAGPTFFKGPEGAPVVISISITVKELQLWYREDWNDTGQETIPERYTSNSGRYNPERRG